MGDKAVYRRAYSLVLVCVLFLLRPDRGAEYCAERVCLFACVCLSAIISSELRVRSSSHFLCLFLRPWLGPPLTA